VNINTLIKVVTLLNLKNYKKLMIFYLTLKKKIYMIEEEWMLSIGINKVVAEEEVLKTYFPCLVEGVVEKEGPLKLKLS